MPNTLTYSEQLDRAVAQARRTLKGEEQRLALLYYASCYGGSASVSWKTYKGSAAGQRFIEKNSI